VIRTVGSTPRESDRRDDSLEARPRPSPAAVAAPSPSPDRAAGGEAEPRNTPAVAPRETRAATAAARAFLAGYLPYSYDRTDAQRIRAAAKSLLRQLLSSPPRVPAAVAARSRPRLVSVRAQAATGGANVLVRAIVDDGPRRYGVLLEVRKVAGAWLVTAVGG
jgi:hypothetical protein